MPVGRPPPSWTRLRHASCSVGRRRPGDVVDGAGARPARARDLVVGVERAAPVAAHLEARLAVGGEAERVGEERPAGVGVAGVGAHAVEPLDRHLGGISGWTATSGSSAVSTSRISRPRPSGSANVRRSPSRATSTPSRFSRSSQKATASAEPTRHTTVCTIPRPARPRRAPGYSKKVMSEPALAGLVGVEQVVDGRVVLVHGLLHQAQPEDARVEVDVPGRVAGDRRHVVDALQLHGAAPPNRVATSLSLVVGRNPRLRR